MPLLDPEPDLDGIEYVWVPAPGWPPVPYGWHPPAGWSKPRVWPKAPTDWAFWQPDPQVVAARRNAWWTSLVDESRTVVMSRPLVLVNLEFIELQALFAAVVTRYVQQVAPVQATTGFVLPSDDPARGALLDARDHLLRELTNCRDLLLAPGVASVAGGDRYALLVVRRYEAVRAFADARFAWFSAQSSYFVTSLLKRVGPHGVTAEIARAGEQDLDSLAEWDTYQTRRARYAAYGTGTGSGVPPWQEAEEVAAEFLRGQGFTDARATPVGADSGIDVYGRGVVAQVKYLTTSVGRPDLQRLVGANQHGAAMAFFSRSGYASTATQYALQTGIALYTIELPDDVVPVNAYAAHLRNAGARW